MYILYIRTYVILYISISDSEVLIYDCIQTVMSCMSTHTDRDTYILTDTPTYWHMYTYWQTHLHTDGLTYILTDTITICMWPICIGHGHIYIMTHLHTDGMYMYWHTDRHTYILTDTPTYLSWYRHTVCMSVYRWVCQYGGVSVSM